MTNSPYRRFSKEELILRDHLAIDRTILQNENTILSYIRTSLTFLISGISFIKFFNSGLLTAIGIFSIVAGILLFFTGLYRYKMVKKDIEKINR